MGGVMWTRVDIVNTPDSIRVQFGPGVGRHVLAWLVMVGAGLSVYAVLEQGDVGPASLVISAVVILLGAVLRMGLRARSAAELSESGLLIERRGAPPQSIALNHLESFVVDPTEVRAGLPQPRLRVHTRSSQISPVRLGAGVGKSGLEALTVQLTERLELLRTV
jgi:hypothetical protein